MQSPRFVFENVNTKDEGSRIVFTFGGDGLSRVKAPAVSSSPALGFASHPLREESALRHVVDLW